MAAIMCAFGRVTVFTNASAGNDVIFYAKGYLPYCYIEDVKAVG